jgi:hypothetical protein
MHRNILLMGLPVAGKPQYRPDFPRRCKMPPPPCSVEAAATTADEAMTDDNIVDIWRGLSPLHISKPWREKGCPAAMSPALKLLLTISLIVAIGGCVNTKPGDFNSPEPPADRRPF